MLGYSEYTERHVVRPCSDDVQRLAGNTVQVPVFTTTVVATYLCVQTPVVGIDDVNDRSLGTANL